MVADRLCFALLTIFLSSLSFSTLFSSPWRVSGEVLKAAALSTGSASIMVEGSPPK